MSFQPTEMTETQATETLKSQGEQQALGLEFTQVDEYTTFRAEYAFDGSDMIFHFFLTAEHLAMEAPEDKKRLQHYWTDSFPRTLDVIARDFFRAEFPRLKAAFTNDAQHNVVASWWLRGYGMADVIDPAARAQAFLAKLDHALDAVNVSQRGV